MLILTFLTKTELAIYYHRKWISRASGNKPWRFHLSAPANTDHLLQFISRLMLPINNASNTKSPKPDRTFARRAVGAAMEKISIYFSRFAPDSNFLQNVHNVTLLRPFGSSHACKAATRNGAEWKKKSSIMVELPPSSITLNYRTSEQIWVSIVNMGVARRILECANQKSDDIRCRKVQFWELRLHLIKLEIVWFLYQAVAILKLPGRYCLSRYILSK